MFSFIIKHRAGGFTSSVAGVLIACMLFVPVTPVMAQTVDPTSITIPDASPVCNDGSATQEVCITLPPESVIDKVDVFFLFDDTGSFSGFVPTVATIFSGLVGDLETALPAVDFGFGVGRFEDYGGPGTGFSSEFVGGRPFLLNQPIVTSVDAGGDAARDALISTALGNSGAGFGGDGPESAIAEGLYQLATGVGFDGDGDGGTTGIGGLQTAGLVTTQTGADASGDVPAFSTLDAGVISSGPVGGGGFRSGALRLAILATDICSIAAFTSPTIPATVSGTGGTEPVAEFACSSTTPGSNRFGFVSDSLTSGGNTIPGAVVPLGSATVPATIAALNAAGIRVLGMAPSGGPTPSGSGPSGGPSVFLSALARLTGALDEFGDPLVFDIGAGGDPLRDEIVQAVLTSTTQPIDITLMTGGALPAGVTVDITPDIIPDVAPGDTACFDVTFNGTGDPMGGFDLNFKDAASGSVLGTIPVSVECIPNIPPEVECNNPTAPNDPGQCGADVGCDVIANCFDPDSGGVVPVCAPPGPYPVGSSDVTVICDDGEDSTTAVCPVTVVDCEDPTCTAPAPVTLECNGPGGVSGDDPAIAALLGSVSAADNCGVALAAFVADLYPDSCAADATTPIAIVASDDAGHQGVCATAVTVVDTTPPDVVCDATIVTIFDDEDDEGDDVLELSFGASDLCCDATAAAVIDIGCTQVPVSDGTILDLTCMTNAFGESPCGASYGRDGVLRISAETAQLQVGATDCSGLGADCTVDLCALVPDDEDEDHDGTSTTLTGVGQAMNPDGLLDLGRDLPAHRSSPQSSPDRVRSGGSDRSR